MNKGDLKTLVSSIDMNKRDLKTLKERHLYLVWIVSSIDMNKKDVEEVRSKTLKKYIVNI